MRTIVRYPAVLHHRPQSSGGLQKLEQRPQSHADGHAYHHRGPLASTAERVLAQDGALELPWPKLVTCTRRLKQLPPRWDDCGGDNNSAPIQDDGSQ